jgi:hypothetical protein
MCEIPARRLRYAQMKVCNYTYPFIADLAVRKNTFPKYRGFGGRRQLLGGLTNPFVADLAVLNLNEVSQHFAWWGCYFHVWSLRPGSTALLSCLRPSSGLYHTAFVSEAFVRALPHCFRA